jgi:signal transduction histidine kinase
MFADWRENRGKGARKVEFRQNQVTAKCFPPIVTGFWKDRLWSCPISVSVASPSLLNDVLRTPELRTRIRRAPDFAAENRALVQLAQVLASSPHEILNRLAQAALHLCGAGSTGISILDSETGGDPNLFRWRALAGAWTEKYLGSVLPRDYSPCGVVLDTNSAQLMEEPARFYDYVGAIDPPCHEVLLMPFTMEGRTVGTIWAAMHDPDKHFDAEDERVLASLAKFTSAGYQSRKATETLAAYGKAKAREAETLAKADRLKDEFIATIAHELRNPLGPIRNIASLLLLAPTDPKVIKRAGGVIERQSSNMSRLIEDLLDVSRVRLGVLELHRSKVDLADVVRTALDSSRLAATRTHPVTLELPREPVYVEGDLLRLTQVVGNLLNNAAKYSDADGHVRVGVFRSGVHAVIQVSDDGIGIPADKLESIFDLFVQAGQAGSPRSQGGLGIGLHLAKKLVEAHQGVLKAESPGADCGSTFTVQLPVA